MFRATKEFKRDMAHRLPTHGGKCFNVHGHTYKALITIQGEHLQEEGEETGMIKDFSNFKPIKDWIDENRDHTYVGKEGDEVLEFLKEKGFRTFTMKNNPTAENMAKLLYEKVSGVFPNIQLDKVVIYETPTSFAEYTTTNELPF